MRTKNLTAEALTSFDADAQACLTRLHSQVSALQQRLNIADQRVCDLTAERDGLQGGCADLSSQVREFEHKMDYWKAQNDTLRSELAKLADDYCERGDELTEARELQENTASELIRMKQLLGENIEALLAHQSAPAAKCETCDGTGHDLDGGINPMGGAADCPDCHGRGAPAAKGGE